MSWSLWGWAILVFAVLGLVQTAIFCGMLSRYRSEQLLHTEAMTMLIVAMQPPDIAEHSRRVAAVSEMLAQEMGLPARRISFIHTAALLHDVMEVDNIPGHLSREAEILIVADYLDELIHDCCKPTSLDNAIEEIRREVGTRFHPAVVRALMRVASRSEPGEI